MILLIYFQKISFITFHFFHEYTHNANKYYVAHQGMSVQRAAKSNHWPFLALICKPPPDHSPVCTTKLTDKLQQELEGKYSLESTDPRESEFAPTCVHNSLLRMCYLFIALLVCLHCESVCLHWKIRQFTAFLDSKIHTQVSDRKRKRTCACFSP